MDIPTISSKIVQLERLVSFMRDTIQQHHRLLHDISQLLGPASSSSSSERSQLSTPQITALQRRIAALMGKQSSCLGHPYFDQQQENQSEGAKGFKSNDELQWAPVIPASSLQRLNRLNEESARSITKDKEDESPLENTNCFSAERISTAANDASEKISQACARMLRIWFQHFTTQITLCLKAPDRAFDGFQSAPSADSLASFVDEFQSMSSNIQALCRLPTERDEEINATIATGSQLRIGPKDNPFEIDQRLQNLFSVTVQESFQRMLSPSSEAQRHDHRVDPKKSKGFEGPPPVIRHEHLTDPHVHRGLEGQSVSAREGPTREGQSASARAQSFSHQPHLQRPPSSNDSSQLQAALFGPQTKTTTCSGKPQSGHRLHELRSPDGNPDVEGGSPHGGGAIMDPALVGGGSRLDELKKQLEQLEFQLGSAHSGSHRSDTGSEAKYYALSKKIQKIRAEYIKEQKQQEEILNSKKEALQIKVQREEHRKQFRR